MAWSSYVLYILCQQETNFSRESVPGECRHDKDGHLSFYPNCAGKELRQALLPFIANAMSCLPSEQDKPEVIYLLKKAGIVFALKDNKVALNLKAIEDVSETPQVQQHKKHYRTYYYTNTERLTQQNRSLRLPLYQWWWWRIPCWHPTIIWNQPCCHFLRHLTRSRGS